MTNKSLLKWLQQKLKSDVEHPDGKTKLDGYKSISKVAMHGGWMLLLGLPFMAVSVLMVLIAFELVPIKGKDQGMGWIIVPMAIAFFTIGAMIFSFGIDAVRIKLRAKRGKKYQPQWPWRWDYHWNPRGIGNRLQPLRYALGFMLLMFLTMIPFNVITYKYGASPPSAAGMTIVINVLTAISIVIFIAFARRQKRYGGQFLNFHNFPMHPGQSIGLTLEGLRCFKDFDEIVLDLRHVEERYVYKRANDNKQVVCYEGFHKRWQLHPKQDGYVMQADRMQLNVKLPDQPLTTQLSARPAQFWVLDLEAKKGRPPYRASFLVPIYTLVN